MSSVAGGGALGWMRRGGRPDRNPSRGFRKNYFANRVTTAATVILAAACVVAIVAPMIKSLQPFALGSPFLHPSFAHPMGTDQLGRDVFARVMWGYRSAFIVGVGAAGLSLIIGTVLGAVAGYFGGLASSIVMRMTDITLSVPIFFIALLVGFIFGAGLYLITAVLGFTMWPATARIVRAEFISVKQRGFIEAARASGAGDLHIIFREILPNAIHPVVALVTLDAAWAILAEAGLSFLGLQDPNNVTWGFMLNEALSNYQLAWWDGVFPGAALALLVLCLNLVGDGINEAWNPRSLGRRLPRRSLRSRSSASRVLLPRASDDRDAEILSVQQLSVNFPFGKRRVRVVDDASFSIAEGEIVGLVGESGSGKTMTALAIAGLVPAPGQVEGKTLSIDGQSVLGATSSEMRSLRSNVVAIAFQDPQSSLNPVMRIGEQITEGVKSAGVGDRREAEKVAEATLRDLRIPAPSRRLRAYPHELSGGMRQRALIGIALSRNPRLLIVDEPTTSLDVITQKQILDLISEPNVQQRRGILLITHDIGVVAEACDRMIVMYAGKVVESGPVGDVLSTPAHPYTQALIAALPEVDEEATTLPRAIPGVVPSPLNYPEGCRFRDRCAFASELCQKPPETTQLTRSHSAACWLLSGERESANAELGSARA